MSQEANAQAVRVRDLAIRHYIRRSGTYFEAVKLVSFEVAPHELVCVVGPSGCGKSTLLSAIAGLIPYYRGEVIVADKVVTKPGPDRAVVFQRPALLPWRSVSDNVAYGLRQRGTPKREMNERVAEMLELVDLTAFASAYPYELSGGMQQRVNLARALAVDPAILLLDEPFSAVDAQTREVLQQELLRIWDTTTKAGIFITHQIDEAVLLADRVIVMSKGPSSVVRLVLDIDLPRPRLKGEILGERKYADYVNEIWENLQIDRNNT